jgi:anaerobic magnesium-protoporphyrin IX monomethyl ester cyclase
MRIVIVNPPHQSIGSRIPRELLPPLGLLAIGGPLIDDGHDVALIDGDLDNLPLADIAARIVALAPDCILIGHNGSTSAHPTVVELVPMLRAGLAHALIVYGGVFPTYHWKEALEALPDVIAVVRGEGEATTVRLMRALADDEPLHRINGIAFRRDGLPFATAPAAMIADLDAYRVGWELIDHAHYSYYGGLRGVVIQFSRGCPHLCSFCGQRGFWTRWRHRDPERFAKEIARLHRQHDVKLISLADENPTTSKKVWKRFLEALIAEDLPDMTMIGTFRADDIVRDADILHLYRKAGFRRFLLGMEHTDEATLEKVRKGSDTKTDREAIRLLRQHGILSLMSWVVGFEEETDRDYWRAFRQLLTYDPDQIVTLYVTPHRWAPFFREAKDRRVIQLDQRRWDYKHQVLANRYVPAWRTFFTIKLIEVLVQVRPKALHRTLLHPDPTARHGMRWYARMGRRVWLHEIWCYLFRDRRTVAGPALAEFWGAPQDHEQESMTVRHFPEPGLRPQVRAKREIQTGSNRGEAA